MTTTPLERALADLPRLLSAHVLISALASGLAVAISLPLAVLVVRRPRARAIALSVAGVVQTIPGLALLALMVPLLGAFGFWPALTALVLYAVLPILRNTVTGLLGVDAAVLEAADGMGMTARQRLWQVELPLAVPVILAGVRTAVVWTVGMATLSTPVGQPSLGSYIFAGLQTRNSSAVLVGCVSAALLALVLDSLLSLLDRSLARRRRAGVGLAAAGLVFVLLAGGLGPLLADAPARAKAALEPTTKEGGDEAAGKGGSPRGTPAPLSRVRVGAKTFTEQYILASAIAARLSRAGVAVERHESLGSNVAFDALRNGDIDVYVEYTGTIWSSYMRREAPESSWRTLASTSAWLLERHGVRLLGALGFENAYCLAMRRDRAASLGIQTLGDLTSRGTGLSLGSDYEFFERAEWTRLRETYHLEFARTTSYDPSFMYSAVVASEVDLITAFSSDGRIDSLDLVVLPDTAHAFPPYDAVLLLSPRAADDGAVVAALEPMLGAIPVERMRRANQMVDRDEDKRTVEQAAEWLLQDMASEGARPD
jgi:osmoprotectant transport system substrate-binding protein/osmoprotectant transport system permease protein